jgi:hypothetical protein
MTRIKCRQPSTGKPINIQYIGVDMNWTIIAEAPDFSVPDPSRSTYLWRDPSDETRGIAAGELFFLTPLIAKNVTAGTDWIEVRFRPEGGTANNDAFGRIVVPAGESVAIPLQGRSLVKRNIITAGIGNNPDTYTFSDNGDILYVRAGSSDSFHIWASANEQASAEHVGVDL